MYYEQRKLKTVFFLIRNKVVSGSVQQVKNYPSNIPSVKSSSPSFFNIAICTKKVYTCEVRRKEMFSTYFYKKKKKGKNYFSSFFYLFCSILLFYAFYTIFISVWVWLIKREPPNNNAWKSVCTGIHRYIKTRQQSM